MIKSYRDFLKEAVSFDEVDYFSFPTYVAVDDLGHEDDTMFRKYDLLALAVDDVPFHAGSLHHDKDFVVVQGMNPGEELSLTKREIDSYLKKMTPAEVESWLVKNKSVKLTSHDVDYIRVHYPAYYEKHRGRIQGMKFDV